MLDNLSKAVHLPFLQKNIMLAGLCISFGFFPKHFCHGNLFLATNKVTCYRCWCSSNTVLRRFGTNQHSILGLELSCVILVLTQLFDFLLYLGVEILQLEPVAHAAI